MSRPAADFQQALRACSEAPICMAQGDILDGKGVLLTWLVSLALRGVHHVMSGLMRQRQPIRLHLQRFGGLGGQRLNSVTHLELR